jgi:hypothetical protein
MMTVLWTAVGLSGAIAIATTDTCWPRLVQTGSYLAGCFPRLSFAYTPARNHPFRGLSLGWLFPWSRKFSVVEARYGVGETWADGAARLNDKIKRDRLNFIVDNETMGGDPAPNRPKVLVITWRVGRETFDSSFSEGTHVVIPD